MSDVRKRVADTLLEQIPEFGAAYSGRVADVLLSLPGIAIVELPTQNVWDLDGIKFGVNPMTPGLAREIAVGLLAAANAADMAEARS